MMHWGGWLNIDREGAGILRGVKQAFVDVNEQLCG